MSDRLEQALKRFDISENADFEAAKPIKSRSDGIVRISVPVKGSYPVDLGIGAVQTIAEELEACGHQKAALFRRLVQDARDFVKRR